MLHSQAALVTERLKVVTAGGAVFAVILAAATAAGATRGTDCGARADSEPVCAESRARPLSSDATARAGRTPRLRLGYVNTVTFDGEGMNRCYTEGAGIVLYGSGFSARERLRVGGHRVRADRRGRLETVFDVPRITTPAERIAITARHVGPRGRVGRVRAVVRIWAVEFWSTLVPGWSYSPPPRTAQPGRAFEFSANGWFAIGVPLYVHYLKDGAEVYAAELGVLQPPCGQLKVPMTEFPFSPVPAGDYTVDFSLKPHYDPNEGAGFLHVIVRPESAVP